MLSSRICIQNFKSFPSYFRKFSSSNSFIDSSLYTWGSGNEGQLGQPSIEKSGIRNAYEELLPKRVETSMIESSLKNISCGHNHSAAIDTNGNLYTWGSSQYGKLGYSGEEVVAMPTLVKDLADTTIVHVHCGEHHTAAIDDTGRLYTWGWGGSFFSDGALGHGNSKTQNSPKLVESLVDEGVRMAQVECGELHTVALTDDGEVYVWGNGEYGRLGNGGSQSSSVPEPMEYFAEMDCIQISAGHGFSLALTKDGKVHSWGKNDHGQLGVGGGISMDVYSMENYPHEIEAFKDINIVQISAGNQHASAVSDDGRLFIWGMKTWLEPREMTILKDEKVVATACGTNYTAAITDDGKLYTCGKGRSSSLGHGDRKTHQLPALVEAMNDVKLHKISCGSSHMAALGTMKSSISAADNDFSLRE